MNPQSLPLDAVSRRSVLSAGGASVAAIALTACSLESASVGSPPLAPGALPSTEPTKVSTLSEIPVGGSTTAMLGQIPIILEQPTAGTVIGFSAVCTHMGCIVQAALEVHQFQCPCHGSIYDSNTGAVINGPTILPLRKLKVSLQGDSVLASLA
jgi:Rieske Fe-S protein